MTAHPRTIIQSVADYDPGYRAAVEAYAIVAQDEASIPLETMGRLWNLCQREYARAIKEMD